MSTVNMLEAKTQLSKLVEQIESGAREEIIIARNGRPVARLVPLAQPRNGLKIGIADGQFPALDYEAFKAMDKDIEQLFLGGDSPA
jgi:prevent-host-death family protein